MADAIRLRKLKEFEAALSDYVVSGHATSILKETPLVILLGVFGSGRNSIISELVKGGKYHFIVSDTTRPPKVRNGQLEQDGVHYFFRKEEDVLADILSGEFLEAEVIHNQQVSGTSIRELRKAHQSGKVPINEVDLQGTVNILSHKPDTIMIFVVPPTYEEWIRRIETRESMSDEEFNNRMLTADKIFKSVLHSKKFKFVINDTITGAAQRVDELVHSGTHSEEHDAEARKVAIELSQRVAHYLQNNKV